MHYCISWSIDLPEISVPSQTNPKKGTKNHINHAGAKPTGLTTSKTKTPFNYVQPMTKTKTFGHAE